jgi:hypothetical protein
VSREPTWSFALYFLRMDSLWYFQNCFEASFPATRVRIFLPPVCSHSLASFFCACNNLSEEWMRDKYLDAHPGRSSDHRHPRRRRRIDHSLYYVSRRLRLRMFSSLCCLCVVYPIYRKSPNKEIYDIAKVGRKEGGAPDYNKVSVSRSHSLSHVECQPRIILLRASAGSRNFSTLCHVCVNWGPLIGRRDLHVNFAASSDAKL